jgi:predicted Na+-dependent transporter
MLLLVLKTSITVLIFAVGLSATMDDVLHLWRRPVLLVKSIAAMYVVMPLTAILMTRVLDLPHRSELALVVLAVCAGAPLLPKKLIRFGGDTAFVFSLIVTTSLLAIATVPGSLHLLSGHFSLDTTDVTPVRIAGVLLKSFLAPLGLGMLVRFANPKLADRIDDPLLRVAGAAMVLCALAALAMGFRLVLEVGWPTVAAFGIFTLAALATGHLLGGPQAADRVSLAVACASRHIGLALLVAANARGRQTLALVVAYLLASALATLPYLRWASTRSR